MQETTVIRKSRILNIKQKLSAKNLYISEYGGMSYCDEWQGSGSYYCHIQNTLYELTHNYAIHFNKAFGDGGYNVIIYLCLNAANSNDYILLQTRFGRMKECKEFAVEFIKEYELSDKFEKEILPKLELRYHPVYTYIDGVLTNIGNTIFGAGSDRSLYSSNTEQYRYYHEGMPNYKQYYHWGDTSFYELKDDGSITETKMWGSGCSQGIAKKELAEKIRRDIESLKNTVNV